MPNSAKEVMEYLQSLDAQGWQDLEERFVMRHNQRTQHTREVLAQMLTPDDIGQFLGAVCSMLNAERIGIPYRYWALLNWIVEVNDANGGGTFGGRDTTALFQLLSDEDTSARRLFIQRLHAWGGSHEPLPEDILERLRDIHAVVKTDSVNAVWKDEEPHEAMAWWRACSDQVKQTKLFSPAQSE